MQLTWKLVECFLHLEILSLELLVQRSSFNSLTHVTLGHDTQTRHSDIVNLKNIRHWHSYVYDINWTYFQEYQGFRIGSDGNLQGVGLFINVEPRTGHLVSYLLANITFNCFSAIKFSCLLFRCHLIMLLTPSFFSQVVLSCIENSPASRAGIHQGDEIVEINGTDQVSSFFRFSITYLFTSSVV